MFGSVAEAVKSGLGRSDLSMSCVFGVRFLQSLPLPVLLYPQRGGCSVGVAIPVSLFDLT